MQKLKNILAQHQALADLTVSAQSQLKLQQVWNQVVPSELARYCQAGALQNKRLTVLVENNAIAAKIKLLTPHLILALQAEQLAVSTLRTQLLTSQQPRQARPLRSLPPCASQSLAQLAEAGDSPLAQQIQHFLAHAKK